MRVNFPSGHVESELEGYEHGEFGSNQLLPVQAENAFDAFNKRLESFALNVVQFAGEEETCGRAELPVLFVDEAAEDEFLEVDVRLGDGYHI